MKGEKEFNSKKREKEKDQFEEKSDSNEAKSN